eukprot:GILK01010573.1.p1 GENE.GILK01010573.1~~GILK01010573.1.p1  ORF type:complete len:1080 (+),score=254.90 GILK01010573.1:173-3412(+)
MLSDMFAEDDDVSFGATYGSYLRPQNCAAGLQRPYDPRHPTGFVGLDNQGATCYLNSLLQACYMTPELRLAILNLDLPVDSTEDDTKTKFLRSFQNLFVNLQLLDQDSVGTLELTSTFGWTGTQASEQHDVQELNRLLFDVLERALTGTSSEGLIQRLYRGSFVNQVICCSCNRVSERVEPFGDICLQVNGLSGVKRSLELMTEFELLNGSNQYFCENCQKKTDAKRGIRIRECPPILTFCLNRFDYDWSTDERKKITSRFAYPLEMDMSPFLIDNTNAIYELSAVIIHRGTAYSGHYHAYIRDMMREGTWIEPTTEPAKELDEGLSVLDPNTETPVLGKCWYDFDDSRVSSLRVDRLSAQFGGSGECAYMLVYRRKDLSPPLKDDWSISSHIKSGIEETNAKLSAQRLEYSTLEALIEINIYIDKHLAPASTSGAVPGVLQCESVDDPAPIKVRVPSAGTMNQFRNRVADELGVEGRTLHIYELQHGVKKTVYFPRTLDDLADDTLLKEATVSHLNCFFVQVDGHGQLDSTILVVGAEREPLSLNVQILGEETSLLVRANTTLSELQELITSISGLPAANQKLSKVEGGVLKAVQRLSLQGDTMRSLQLSNGSQLFVDFQEEQETQQAVVEPVQSNRIELFVVDEDEKTTESFLMEPSNTLYDVLNRIRTRVGVKDGEHIRLRRMQGGKGLFHKEQENSSLQSLSISDQTRFKWELGPAPSVGQIQIRFALEPQAPSSWEILVAESDTIKECKAKMAAICNLDVDAASLSEYRLFRTNWLEEVQGAVKKEDETVSAAGIAENDFILLMKLTDVESGEALTIQVFKHISGPHVNGHTVTGNCTVTKCGDLNVPLDCNLNGLKAQLLSFSEFSEVVSVDLLRVRELSRDNRLGKIYKEGSKSLKKLQIAHKSSIAIQVLPMQETLSSASLVVYLQRRIVSSRSYEEPIEVVIEPTQSKEPTFSDLRANVEAFCGFQPDSYALARFVPYKYIWTPLQDGVTSQNGGKGKKGKQTLAAAYNLRDGDIIAVKLLQDDPSNEDDFMTAADRDAAMEAEKRKEEERKARRRPRGQEVALRLMVDF